MCKRFMEQFVGVPEEGHSKGRFGALVGLGTAKLNACL
ncbi:hypothetical protein SAMN05519103_06425 [Rhizobiales bacterium GAS113]|nr:hypothetical protein SAMN05519103_06425 [Rhizobiales bacterium GAS113]